MSKLIDSSEFFSCGGSGGLTFFPHYSRSFLFLSTSIQSPSIYAMGRHNGGTRSKGGNLAVGAALTNKQKGKIRPGAPKGSTEPTSHRHTTEAPASGLQSMLDATDLSELMDMVRGGKGGVSLSFSAALFRRRCASAL